MAGEERPEIDTEETKQLADMPEGVVNLMRLRCDAVLAIELIQKSLMEILETMSREEQIRLLKDSDEVIKSILHDWRSEWKTLATVIHFDEFGGKVPHPHNIFMLLGRDEDCSQYSTLSAISTSSFLPL